jgi:hypothetical protein
MRRKRMAQGLGERSTTEGVSSGLNLEGKRILVTAVMVDGKSWRQIEIELNTSSRIAAPPTIRDSISSSLLRRNG